MKNSVLPSVVLTCAVFSSLTAPLAAFGSDSINIELQKEQVFAGSLKDVATPYLGIAGLISLGAGAVSLSVAEWRRSARKSVQAETKMTELQTELKQKSAQFDELRLSDSYLAQNGLQSFLENGVKLSSAPEKVAKAANSAIQQKPSKASVSAEERIQSQPYHSAANTVVETSKSRLTVERKQEAVDPSAAIASQVTELQNQLKQMAAYIESLQSAWRPATVTAEASKPNYAEIERLQQRLQLLELDWIRHQIAS